MYYMAKLFRSRFPQFEIDELVNEFWLSTSVQTMKDVRMIWKSCKWAFYLYYRKQNGLSTCTGEPLIRCKGKTISFEDVGREDIKYEPEYIEGGFDDIDAMDFRDTVFQGLSPKERAVCGQRAGGKTLAEVSRSLSVSRERVRQIERSVLDRKVKRMLCA